MAVYRFREGEPGGCDNFMPGFAQAHALSHFAV